MVLALSLLIDQIPFSIWALELILAGSNLSTRWRELRATLEETLVR
jgi:hypothetical protein